MLKNKIKFTSDKKITIKWVVVFFIFAFTLNAAVSAQEKKFTSPSEEQFKSAFGCIIDSVGLGKRIFDDRRETDTYRIYNKDGSIWYEFSSFKSNPLYYEKNPKADFKPIRFKRVPHGANFELIGESENWYRVIINDETRDSRYIWKHDIMFDFSSWERLIKAFHVKFDKEKNPLRETPGGNIKDVEIPVNMEMFFTSSISGDWLLVYQNVKAKEQIAGWIRWKENKSILIRFWDGESLKFATQ